MNIVPVGDKELILREHPLCFILFHLHCNFVPLLFLLNFTHITCYYAKTSAIYCNAYGRILWKRPATRP